MNRELNYELTGGPYAVTAARLALSELDDLVDEGLAFDLRLLVSELVTNSVKHAQVGPEESIYLNLAVEPGTVRVEVIDNGPGFTPPVEPESTDHDPRERGWGLFFVTQLADRWGVEGDDGSRVWFEIDRAGEEQAGQNAA